MKKYFLIVFVIVTAMLLCTVFMACEDAGLSTADDTTGTEEEAPADENTSENTPETDENEEESTGDENTSEDTSVAEEETEEEAEEDPAEEPEPIATLTVLDPPAPDTRLPEISGTINHELSYTISDEYFNSTNTYRITGYFRATDSVIQVFQTTVTDQSDDSVTASFEIPSGFPVTPTTVTPYQLFYQLTDETNGTLVLDDSSDLIYEDWIFTGVWYGIDWKSEVTNMGFQVWLYDTENEIYENGNKGTIVNKAGNQAEMTITHNWEEGAWVESAPPEGGTYYYVLDNNKMINATDEELTEVFRVMTSEPTTYDEDYAGKWWTGDVKLDENDNGIIIYMSDTEFRVRRDGQDNPNLDEQNKFPVVELGTIATNGNVLTLTVTHEAIEGKPGYFTPVDPNEPDIEYIMTYSSSSENTLTLTAEGTNGGDYADPDGIDYID